MIFTLQVKEALTNKLVGYQTPVSLNPITGELQLANSENALLVPLLKLPEIIDWLSDVELTMAREAKPHETVQGVAAQIAELQVSLSGDSPSTHSSYILSECRTGPI